jgi:hypothetical protein
VYANVHVQLLFTRRSINNKKFKTKPRKHPAKNRMFFLLQQLNLKMNANLHSSLPSRAATARGAAAGFHFSTRHRIVENFLIKYAETPCTAREKALSLFSTAQHSTAQHSTAQHSTAQHITAQHSTAQHSTAQHST